MITKRGDDGEYRFGFVDLEDGADGAKLLRAKLTLGGQRIYFKPTNRT